MYSIILMSAKPRLGVLNFLFCFSHGSHVQHTQIRNFSPYMHWFSSGRELGACVYWMPPLWRVLRVLLAQACPLVENHCPRLRHKLSISKISARKQALWSVTSAVERKRCLLPSSCFPVSQLFSELGEPGGGFGWVGSKRWLLLISPEPQGALPCQTSLPQGLCSIKRRKVEAVFPQSPVFLWKASLWLLCFTYSLVSRRSTGATDTATISVLCSAKRTVWAGSLSVSLVTTPECPALLLP